MLEKTVYEHWAHSLLDHYPARCSETGARLSCSNGRSRYGRLPKWYINFDEMHHRYTLRASNLDEAIEAANKRLMKEYKKGLAKHKKEQNELFDLTDQQASIPEKYSGWPWLSKPDEHAILWSRG